MCYQLKVGVLAFALAAPFISPAAGASDGSKSIKASQPSAAQARGFSWTNVPTKTISAQGVNFAYRELGTRNGGVPVCS